MMSPDISSARNVIIQGITGSHGTFHARAMVAAGTNVIAGTSPKKGGEKVDNIPVYESVAGIKKDFRVDISVIFVPAKFAKSATLEAIDAEVPLIICITEGIPIHDMLYIRQRMIGKLSTLIGPNSPGILMPGVNKLGIIPAKFGLPGRAAIVSRSGTLTYETAAGLTIRGIGQKYVIGIGGDPIHGSGFIECLELFQSDPDVDNIVLVGEVGGTDEQMAAEYIKLHVTKPVYAYIAGHHAPAGVQLGHAGAIMGSADESASAKTKALSAAGVKVSDSITELINSIKP